MKILIENFLSLSSLQIVNYLLPLITLPYLTKVIGVEIFGILAIAAATVVYFKAFVDFGFDYSATRDIANNQNDIEFVSKIFWTVIFTKLVLIIISLFVLILLIIFVPFFKNNYLIILLTYLCVPVGIFFPEWFFQGMEKMKYITILNVISKILFTILVFVIIKEPGDYIYQPILIVSGYFVSGVFSVYLIFNHFGVIMYWPSLLDMKTALKGSYDIFINKLLPNLYNSTSTLLLGYWWGNSQVGILDAGKKVITLSEQAFMVISKTFFPYLANNIKKHNLFYIMSLLVGITFMIIYLIGADFIVNILFPEDFEDSKKIIRIMAVSPVLFSLINSFGTNYLILIHREKVLRNITLFSSLCGLFAAIFFVYKYQVVGAALTLIIARSMTGGLCFFYSRKYKKRYDA